MENLKKQTQQEKKMLLILWFVISLRSFGEATLEFKQMLELVLNAVLQINVPPTEFTRTVTENDGLKFNSQRKFFEISEEALISGTSSKVLVLKANLADSNLRKIYTRYIPSRRVTAAAPKSPTGEQQRSHAFAFHTKGDDVPNTTEIAKILKVGITVTVDVGERHCSLKPHQFEMQIVKVSETVFGVRIPQQLLIDFGLDQISMWSMISYKMQNNSVNLERENFANGKEYCYAVPTYKHPKDIPDELTMGAIRPDPTNLNPIKNKATVVEVYGSNAWEKRVQMEVDRGQITLAHMLSGYHGRSKGVSYTFDTHFLWQFVMLTQRE